DPTINLVGTTVAGNNAGLGGGLHLRGTGTTRITDSSIVANGGYVGGGIGDDVTKLIVTGSSLASNRASSFGGAISTSSATNDTFVANAAQKDGAIYVTGPATTTLTMIDDTLDGNTATATSGGVEQILGTLVVQGTILAGNTAAGAPSDYTYTGGTLTDKGG